LSQSQQPRTEPRSRRLKATHLAGAIFLAAGIIFTIFNTIAESIYPNFDVGKDALSNLGALGQNTTLLWDGQLFIASILGLLAVTLLLFRSSLSDYLQATPIRILYFLPGIGSVIVSLFPDNTVLAIHSLGAFTSFVFGAISAIYAFRFTKPPFRYFSLVLGIVSLGTIPFLGDPSILGFGGVERLVVYPYTIWGIAFGAYLTAL
jgi:hypothetical membrane protein